MHLRIPNYMSVRIHEVEVKDCSLCAWTLKLAFSVYLSHWSPVAMAKTWQQHVSVACQPKCVLLDVVHAPWRQKDRDAVYVNLKQNIIMNNLHMHYDSATKSVIECFFYKSNMLSTCDSVKSIETVIYSNNVQERDSPIFKSLSGRKKTVHFREKKHRRYRRTVSFQRKSRIWQACTVLYLSEMFAACT